MSPRDLRAIRLRVAPSLSQAAFARAIGYKDHDSYRKYESGARPMPVLLVKLMTMLDAHGMPEDW